MNFELLVNTIQATHNQLQQNAIRSVNIHLTIRNWLIGFYIVEFEHFLVDHNLNYTYKLSTATGVEVRAPLLDKELVEFSTRIPPKLKMKNMTTKYLLKKVMERYLPYEVIHRPNADFGIPVSSWIKHDLRLKISDRLNKENIANWAIFDFESVTIFK